MCYFVMCYLMQNFFVFLLLLLHIHPEFIMILSLRKMVVQSYSDITGDG